MSPDNYQSNPLLKRLFEANANFVSAFPSLGKLMLADDGSFRGLTIFIGDTAEYVVGVRIFGDDGTPMIGWSSGNHVLECLVNADRLVSSGKFKVDKKAVENGR